MAIAFSNLTSGASTTNGSTTASISPTANAQVYVTVAYAWIGGDSTSASDSLSISGCGITWTQVARAGNAGSDRRWIYVFSGTSASPSSGSLTITANASAGQTYAAHAWSVDEATGVDSGTPIGTATTNFGSGTSGTVTVTGTPDAGDFVFCAMRQENDEAMTINGELSNELADVSQTSDVRRIATGYDSTPDSTPVPGFSWSSSGGWAGIAFIVNVGEEAPATGEYDPIPIPQPLPGALGVYRSLRGRIG